MIELTDIPNVNAYLHRQRSTDKKYSDTIIGVVNAARDYLARETMFIKQVACELNDERVLREMFDELINTFILNYADAEGFETYNIMTNDYVTLSEPICFWDLWRKDLFDYMLRTYR